MIDADHNKQNKKKRYNFKTIVITKLVKIVIGLVIGLNFYYLLFILVES